MTFRVLTRTAQVTVNTPNASQAFDFNGATVSLLAFSFTSRALATGDTLAYCADNGTGQYERGVGTWDNTAKTLTRTTIRESSTGSAIVWTSPPTVWSDGRQDEDGLSGAPIPLIYAPTITPFSLRNGLYRLIMTGNVTINTPSSPQDGDRVKIWATASGANRTISLGAGFVIPSSSVLTFPVTVNSGKKVKILFEYDATLNGGQWEVTSFVNGF